MTEQPTTKVLCLRPFLLGPGRMARPQEVYDVPLDVATNAVALKNARHLNDDDLAAAEAQNA